MTEKQLQAAVVRLAQIQQWKVYHTYDSRRSEPGFPDLVLARDDQLMFVELKSAKGKVTEAQEQWLRALVKGGAIADVWRPDDWHNGTIERVLGRAG